MSRGLGHFVSIPAWASVSGRFETIWIDASQVSAVGVDGRTTFIDCGKTTFRTSLSVDDVMALVASVTEQP